MAATTTITTTAAEGGIDQQTRVYECFLPIQIKGAIRPTEGRNLKAKRRQEQQRRRGEEPARKSLKAEPKVQYSCEQRLVLVVMQASRDRRNRVELEWNPISSHLHCQQQLFFKFFFAKEECDRKHFLNPLYFFLPLSL